MKKLVSIIAIASLALPLAFCQDAIRVTHELRTRVIKRYVIDTMQAPINHDLSKLDLYGNVASVKRTEIIYRDGLPLTDVNNSNNVVYYFDKYAYITRSERYNAVVKNTSVVNYLNSYYKGKIVGIKVSPEGSNSYDIDYRYDYCGNINGCDTIREENKQVGITTMYDRFHNPIYQKQNPNDENAYEFFFNYKYDNSCLGCILVKSVDRYDLHTKQYYNYTSRYTYNEYDQVASVSVEESNGFVSLITYIYNELQQLIRKEMKLADAYVTETYNRDDHGSCTCKTTYIDGKISSQTLSDITYLDQCVSI